MTLHTDLNAYKAAATRRAQWETLWQDCYDLALPNRGSFTTSQIAGKRRHDDIYDATALDSADQLASSLLGNLTPIWSQWFGLKPGLDLSDEEADKLAPVPKKQRRLFRIILIAPTSRWRCINATWILSSVAQHP